MRVIKIVCKKDGVYGIAVSSTSSGYEYMESAIINIDSISSIDISESSFIKIYTNMVNYRIQFNDKNLKEPFIKSLLRDINIESILEK